MAIVENARGRAVWMFKDGSMQDVQTWRRGRGVCVVLHHIPHTLRTVTNNVRPGGEAEVNICDGLLLILNERFSLGGSVPVVTMACGPSV